MSNPNRWRQTARGLRRTVARFRPYLRGQTVPLVVAISALVAEVLLRLAEPWPLKIVFDSVLPSSNGASRAHTLLPDAMSTTTVLALAAAAVIVLALLRAGAAYVNTVGFALVGNRVLTAVRMDLFSHLQRLSLRFHTRSRTGDLLTRVVGDVGRLQEVAVTALAPLVVHAATLIGMLIVMFVLNWQLGLMAAAMFPLIYLSMSRIGRRIRQAARQQRKREGEIAAGAAEGLAAIRAVQSLGLEDQQSRLFARSNSAGMRESVKSARLSAGLERAVDCLIGVVTAAVLWRGAVLVLREQISPGDLVVFLAYLKNAFKPLRDVAKYTGRLAKAAASGERVIEVLDAQPEIVDAPGAEPAPRAITEVRFEDVEFSYEPGPAILSGLNLSARLGEKIALVGPSGTGKSTIASLLLRLYDPTGGRILLNGRDIRTMTVRSLRERFAVMPQDSTLFGLTIRQNILHGHPSATEDEVAAACEAAGAWEFLRDLPLGLDTVIGERGETLSGGQRRRIALARAAVRPAPILLLDEPTTGLDNAGRSRLNDALARLGEGRLTILISHDLAAASDADQILYLEHGRVVELGTHASLMAQSGRYAAMYLLQAAGDAEYADPEASHALPG